MKPRKLSNEEQADLPDYAQGGSYKYPDKGWLNFTLCLEWNERYYIAR